MVEIIPAILPKSLKALGYHLGRLRGVASLVQIDVVGGGFFTFNRSWPFRNKRSFTNIVKKNEKLPFWTEFNFEVDLMVDEPKELALIFVQIGASRVVIHSARRGALDAVQTLADYTDEDRPESILVGVALGVDDVPDSLQPFESYIDYVQVMGIKKIGYQGRRFDDRAVKLVERLRDRYPELIIQVDGGVAPHVRELAKAGANRLVVGSAIVNSKDPNIAYNTLYTEANAHGGKS